MARLVRLPDSYALGLQFSVAPAESAHPIYDHRDDFFRRNPGSTDQSATARLVGRVPTPSGSPSHGWNSTGRFTQVSLSRSHSRGQSAKIPFSSPALPDRLRLFPDG